MPRATSFMGPRFRLFLASATVLLGLVAAFTLSVRAAVQDCTSTDVSDAADDVTAEPAGAGPVTGFDQIDILSLCAAETAEGVHLVLTAGAAVGTTSAQELRWTIAFEVDGSAATVALSSEGGQNAFTPTGAGEVSGAKIQFNLALAEYPLGSKLSAFAITTQGTFAPSAGELVTGSDRAPDAAGSTAPFSYTVGGRAPAGQDSDKDGVPDREEVAAGTNPGKTDSDEDGLLDGAELKAGLNATNPDTDGDGLLDGDNLTLPLSSNRARVLARTQTPLTLPDGSGKFVGEAGVKTDPLNLDTDGDGLIDGNEVRGSENSKYLRTFVFEEFPGSTDPATADSDGDGLLDGEETAGRATIEGERKDFSPTDPNSQDTDGDGLEDRDEVRGLVEFPKDSVHFVPTDPTKGDTDGDGFDDQQELSSGSNPHDPADEPAPGGPESEVSYFLISSLSVLVLVLLCVAGILWRWA